MASWREAIGRRVGSALAIVTGGGARLRHARFFHPEGVVYRAQVVPVARAGPEGTLAERLAGPALVRFSNAWWRGGSEWPDVLGCAVRFRRDARATPVPGPGDQDLLFATIRWPWTTPLAPLATDQHDFLANDYHAVSPFDVDGLGRAKLRLLAPKVALAGPDRAAKLERAVREGVAAFVLQVRRKVPGAPWLPVAELRVRERVELDQEALRFWPFREGRGIHPRGVVHAMRARTYLASQRQRPRSDARH